MLNIGKSKRSTTFTLDLTDALDELIDPGTYAAIVSAVEAIRDDTKILVTFHVADETGEILTTINDSFSKTPSGSRKLKHFLASAQLLPADPKDNKIVIDPNAWVGATAVVNIIVTDYTNRAGEPVQKNEILSYEKA
jgi:hypothetical protein